MNNREAQQVVAASEIPAGARTAPFALSGASSTSSSVRLRVQLNSTGEISVFGPAPKFWPRLCQFAPDCHSQNVRLCRLQLQLLQESQEQHGGVVLQAIRRIGAGEPLLLWFSEDLLVTASIPPYLAPINIKGGKSYVCNHCGREYEAPNQLKLHLALNCGQEPMEAIWERLAASPTKIRVSPPLQLATPLDFSMRTIRAPFFVPPQALGVSRSFLRQLPDSTSSSTPPSAPPPPETPRNGSQQARRVGLTASALAEQHAHLEALVSNMGKGKNGHVCLYCGKLYSRKYGLKIHIRTHTGYKPLACKICHRPFGDPSNLNKHVRLHNGEGGAAPYRCDICGKILVRRRDLERHIQSRHAELLSGGNSKFTHKAIR